MVGNTKPGNKSTVTVFRRGAAKDLPITVAEIEPDEKPGSAAGERNAPPKPKASPAAQQLGLAVVELTDAQKKELKVKGGVRVVSAAEAAARAGLREGDVILGIANTEIAGMKDFDAVLAKVDKSKPINVLFRRGEWTQYLVIRPSR
jgi:serine protease Do